MPQTPPSADPRPLTGEPLCLDLLNTRWIDDTGHRDLLDSVAGLAIWLHSAGLRDRATADHATLDALLHTRDALLALVDEPRTPQGFEALNYVLARGVVRYRISADGPATRQDVDDPAWLPAWLAAADYLRLIAVSPGRIKQCGGCVLHFHDTTKNGTRRWCSMATCGNRAKAARHYRRDKDRPSRD